MRKTYLVKQLASDLNFVSDSQDVQAIRESVGKKAEKFDSFFVKVREGEYTQVYGITGIVPYLDRIAIRLL